MLATYFCYIITTFLPPLLHMFYHIIAFFKEVNKHWGKNIESVDYINFLFINIFFSRAICPVSFYLHSSCQTQCSSLNTLNDKK